MSDEQEYATGGYIGPPRDGDAPLVNVGGCSLRIPKPAAGDSIPVKLSDAVFIQTSGPPLTDEDLALIAKLIV